MQKEKDNWDDSSDDEYLEYRPTEKKALLVEVEVKVKEEMPSKAAIMPSKAAIMPSKAAIMPSKAAIMPSKAALNKKKITPLPFVSYDSDDNSDHEFESHLEKMDKKMGNHVKF